MKFGDFAGLTYAFRQPVRRPGTISLWPIFDDRDNVLSSVISCFKLPVSFFGAAANAYPGAAAFIALTKV
jgi:hypothetical protein